MLNAEKKLNFFTTIRFLWDYIKDFKLQYFMFYVGWFVQTVVGVVTPIVFGDMINQIIYENNLPAFLRMSMLFLGITIVGIILYYVVYEMYGRLWNALNRRLRMGMFEQLQKLEATELTDLQDGETANMIQFWSYEGVHFMIRNIVHNANNIFRIILCISILFWVNPVFGAVSLIMVPIAVFSTFKINGRIRENSEKNKEHYSKYISWLFEIANSFAELRIWSAEKTILNKYNDKLKELNKQNSKIEMETAIGGELLANIQNVILVVQYGFLAYHAIWGDMKIGMITVMLTYFGLLSSSLSELVSNNMDAQKRIAVIERIRDFLKKTKIDDVEKTNLEEKIEKITFSKCSFWYNDCQEKVLDSVSFSIACGEKVAIVGGSGAGKSTLLNLVLGLYHPKQGEILLNGNNITQYNRSSLYQYISVVFQQILLFKGTIRENLQMGEDIAEEELMKACKAAGIYEYILNQENGFDTIIESWGKNLSGGQRQRLGIARAYLKKSDLVIMDEATSSLDVENEALILENLDEILQGRTCLVVSHRLSTVMSCDRIILLKNGKIGAIGTPTEMKNKCLEFKELFVL